MDRNTGYAGQTDSAWGSEPYSASKPFYVAPLGFDVLIDRMQEEAVRIGVQIWLDSRAVDVVRGNEYSVQVKQRRGDRFVTKTLVADNIIMCAPPHVWRDWEIFKRGAKSLSSSVDAEVLHHIYVRWNDPEAPIPRESRINESFGHIVTSQYDNSLWWQISYSSGRVARLWHNLALHSPKGFLSRIKDAMREAVSFDADFELQRHFWPFAIHKWKAVPNFDLSRAVAQSISPNPKMMPGIYCAGEAFSSYQGWAEGAMETAEMVLDRFRGKTQEGRSLTSSRWTVFVEGRPIDVSKFKDVHPGGIGALQNHVGENVDDFLHHVGHSDHAWAIINSLKTT